MSTELLKRMLAERQVYRTGELTRAGVESRTIMRAIANGLVERPVLIEELGPVPGIIVTTSSATSPDRDACIALLLTGGILSGQYAAMRHGLCTSLESRIEVTALKGATAPPEANVLLRWTRNAEQLERGVETEETSLGLPIRITGEARTVVDLLRSRTSRPDDYRHGLTSLGTYLERGGHVAEVMEIAEGFGRTVSTAVEIACNTASEAHQRSFGA
jgi:hypothetical protein